MNLVLIGCRASGKTAVGRELAGKLNRPLVDTDALIEAAAGRTIPAIIASNGWDHFRELEKKAVAEACAKDHQVIATGGGAVLNVDNVARMRQTGCVVWLKAGVDAIQARLRSGREQLDSRPPLTGSDSVSEVEQILREREPLYIAAAHLTIDTSALDIAQVADFILAKLPDMNVIK